MVQIRSTRQRLPIVLQFELARTTDGFVEKMSITKSIMNVDSQDFAVQWLIMNMDKVTRVAYLNSCIATQFTRGKSYDMYSTNSRDKQQVGIGKENHGYTNSRVDFRK